MEIVVDPWLCPHCTYNETTSYYCCSICGFEDSVFHIISIGEARTEGKFDRMYEVFRKRSKILLPVLACFTVEQFQKNLDYLIYFHRRRMIQGVWIVTTNCTNEVVAEILRWTRLRYPYLWVGVNLIGEHLPVTLEFVGKHRPDGLWMDRSYVTENEIQTVPRIILDQFARNQWNGLYFGGVLFKYIPEYGDQEKVLRNSVPYMDVLCTSGEATGVPITKEKLDLVASTVGSDIPIAIASGITKDTVDILKHKAHIYIFREGCVDTEENIDPQQFEPFILSVYQDGSTI